MTEIIDATSDEILNRETEIAEDLIALETEVLFESDTDMSSNIPKIGKWYMFLTVEESGKSRYWISPLNKSSTFVFKSRLVQTKIGPADGLSCPIVSKRVGAAPDFRTGKMVGVYQILNTPTFARAGVKIQELRDALTKEEIDKMIKAHTYNVALRLKELLRLKTIQVDTLHKAMKDMEIDVVKAGGEIADTIVSLKRAGANSLYDQLRRANQKGMSGWFRQHWLKVIIAGIIIFGIWLLFVPK